MAAVLLTIHNNEHLAAPRNSETAVRQRAPKIDRPKISAGSSEETWNTFITRWAMFKRSTGMAGADTVQQLFHCCDEDLGDSILKGHPDAINQDEDCLLHKIKQMAVIPVAISVRRADLLNTKQDHGENVRSLYAKVKGKAATCSYSIVCTSETCTQAIDFTNVMVKDVVISGLVDEEIKKEVLGWSDLDEKSIEETITFIEAKEMARDALSKAPIAAGVSSYKKLGTATDKKPATKVQCKICKSEIEKLVWNRRQQKMIERTHCLSCWKKKKSKTPIENATHDETSALMIGGVTMGVSETVPLVSSSISSDRTRRGKKQQIILDHHIFLFSRWLEKVRVYAAPYLET